MKIPFGKPFPGIDSASLKDGVASGLVNGFINETSVDVESIPGHRHFTTLETITGGGSGPSGVSRYFNGSLTNYLKLDYGLFGPLSASCAWIKMDAPVTGSLQTIYGNIYGGGMAFQINALGELQISFAHDANSDLRLYLSVPCPLLQAGVPLFVAFNVTENTPFTGPVTVDFYAGLTAATVALIGTATTGLTDGYIHNNGVQVTWIGSNNFGEVGQFPFKGYIDRLGRWNGIKNLTLAEWQEVANQDGALPALVFDEYLAFFLEMTGADPEPVLFSGGSGTAMIINNVTTGVGIADTSRLALIPPTTTLGKVDGLYETLGNSGTPSKVIAVSGGQVFTVNPDMTYTAFTGDMLNVDIYPYFCEDGQNVFISHGGKIARLDMGQLTVTLLNQNTPNHVTHIVRAKGYLACNGDDFLVTSSIFDAASIFDNAQSLEAVVVLHDQPGWIVATGQGSIISGNQGGGRIYLSKDNGNTWAKVFTDPESTFIQGLEYMGGGVVIAGTGTVKGKILRSINHGQTWNDLGQLGSSTQIHFVRKVTDLVVIAGAGSGPGLGRLFRSVDAGMTWADIGEAFGEQVTAGDALNAAGTIVSLAVIANFDNFTNLANVRAWRSTDTAATFTQNSQSFDGADYVTFIQRITNLVSIMSNGFVSTPTTQKIWRSIDGGVLWNLVPIPGFSENTNPSAACVLADGSVLIGTAGNNLDVGGAQIWKSIDDGLTWFLVSIINEGQAAAIAPYGLKETHTPGTVIATGRSGLEESGKTPAVKWQTAVGGNAPQGDCFFAEIPPYESIDSWERFNAQATPDRVSGVFTHRGLIYAGGPRSIEMNYSSGDAEFPWAVSDPALPFGLLAPNSWQSWDELDTIMYLTNTDKGVKVVQLRGRQQQGISDEYDQILNDRTIITRPQDAKAWAITIRGLRFYVISFQVDNLTLIYNLMMDHWARWAYWNGNNYEAALINAYVYSTEQNRHFFGSRMPNGKVFTMDLFDFTDDGSPIVWEYTSGHVSRKGDNAKFPARYLGRYKRGFSIDSTIPEVLLSWRDDGRASFNLERPLSLGETGDQEFYVAANRLGMYRTRQWKQRAFLSKCRLIFSGADES